MGFTFGGNGGSKKEKKPERKSSERSKGSSGDFYIPDPDDLDDMHVDEGGTNEFLELGERNIILILPPSRESGLRVPWAECYRHFMFDKNMTKWLGIEEWPETVDMEYLCRKETHGKPCAVCDKAAELKKGTTRDKQIGSKWYPAMKCVANAVVPSGAGGKSIVKPFRFGKSIRNPLLQALKDGDTFCDPTALMPIRILKRGTGMKTRYDVKVLLREDTVRIKQEWVDNMFDLNSYMPSEMDSDEADEIFDDLFIEYGSSKRSSKSDDEEKYGFAGRGKSDDDGDDDDNPRW